MSATDRNLDLILIQLGEFGKYQRLNFFLICLAIVYSTMQLSYVFTARNVDYRCKIDNCDPINAEYNPKWLESAVPIQNGIPSRCEKYKTIPISNATTASLSTICPAVLFDNNRIEPCTEFVYKDPDRTIVQDFDIHCEENLWKLTTVGTVNNIGQFVCLPIAGYISDRWGRRTILVSGLLLSVLFGLLRSISTSYIWFLLCEFFDLAAGGAAYSSGFILAVELVGPDKRVLSGTIISSCYAIGEVLMTLPAWLMQSWRPFLQIAYAPGILLISYFWITPESVRWLLAKGKYKEATDILRKAAKVNNKTISEDALKKLAIVDEDNTSSKVPIGKIFKSPVLILRVITCSFCWITCGFVFYGLSLNSVAIAGNLYLNFVSSALIEIPAYIATYLFLDRFGRRFCLCASMFIAGLSCLSFIFIPPTIQWLALSMYLLGKFGATAAFTVTYVYTSEMFPTPLRHLFLGTCSMFGRIGCMVAPQAPLLAQLWTPLPILMFASMSVLSGFMALTFPETLNTKLPDTIEEAENIGFAEKKLNLAI